MMLAGAQHLFKHTYRFRLLTICIAGIQFVTLSLIHLGRPNTLKHEATYIHVRTKKLLYANIEGEPIN